MHHRGSLPAVVHPLYMIFKIFGLKEMITFFRGHYKEIRLILAGTSIGAGIGVLILYGFSGTFLWSLTGGLANPADVPSPFVGSPAPNFALQTLSGSPISLSDVKGKVVLLNFWATWCAPCQLEMPLLQARASQYPADLVILGIDYNEDPTLVQDFVSNLKITFPILLDPGSKVQDLYRVRGYPTTVFVDGDGIIRVVQIGELSGTMLDNYLKRLGIGT
jgi:thiol-disulfide isomerase/thioredoxin